MTNKYLFTYCFAMFMALCAFSQKDTINLLEEVKLKNNFSKQLNSGYQVLKVSHKQINTRRQSLGNLLQQTSNLYFKQNGNGMVSSISLRGSGASQTGVFWNGIAINSPLNGQTDFNTFSANGFNQIDIRKGGGSTLFGSGAIGGAINLSDRIFYKDSLQATTGVALASFNTQKTYVNASLSKKSFFAKIALDAASSDNDYEYYDTGIKNENGNYQNAYFKTALGYKINDNNSLNLFFTLGVNDRDLSRTLTAISNSKLKNDETRLLFSYLNNGLHHNSKLNIAFFNEQYRYFANKDEANYSIGKSNSLILKYDFKYFLSKAISFHTGLENRNVAADGTNLEKKRRNNFEAYALVNHKPLENLTYNIGVRKGVNDEFSIPFIYTLDANYKLSKKFLVRANYSTNYRLPTFNDLYWANSGNPNLKAEFSKTGEIGFAFAEKNIETSLSFYTTQSEDLIQWRPTGSNWQPVNVQNVAIKGLEFEFNYQKQIKEHQLSVQTSYAYTISTDENLDKQLLYVPYHKGNLLLDYAFKSCSALLNQQYNGKAYITTSNSQFVDAFWLTNLSLAKTFFKNKLTTTFTINNLLGVDYEVVAYRPMPNRNFELNINFNF